MERENDNVKEQWLSVDG